MDTDTGGTGDLAVIEPTGLVYRGRDYTITNSSMEFHVREASCWVVLVVPCWGSGRKKFLPPRTHILNYCDFFHCFRFCAETMGIF